MLTRLRVQGFKNLHDVEVRFGPLTSIAGENATGKSNLFDALHFLRLLTRYPILEAAQRLRESKGRSPEPRSLFTTIGSYRAPEMRFTADLLLEREVEDEFGVGAVATISSVRYEVAFRLNDEERPERLELAHESLEPRRLSEARKELGFPAHKDFKDSVISGRRGVPFISTRAGDPGGPEIQVHQEGHGGRRVPAPKSSRTVLGGMASSDFPTLLAAHREMRSWRTLMLEPSAMRAPSGYRDPAYIDGRGANLPAAVERLCSRRGDADQIYSELANRLAELIDDVRAVRVRDDETTETLTLEVQGCDGTFHPARSLSDGTLRFLVLAILAIDPETKGVISLEEPENGIHPTRIPAMLRLLRDIAVDPELPPAPDNPLRQVLVNTHSPGVVRAVDRNDLVHVRKQRIFLQGNRAHVVSVTAPKGTWRYKMPGSPTMTSEGDLEPYYEPQLALPLEA